MEPASPLLRQYHAIKKQHPQALLLFRLGDFYELFYDDAQVASRLLQITLTARNREKGAPVPMCGVPYHAAESYIARLIRAGHRVAACDAKENNFLAAVSRDASGTTVGLAYVDLSTGDFRATEFSGPGAETRLRDELGILRAREVLLPRPVSLFPAAGAPELNGLGAVETRLDDWIFHHEFATRLLEEQFRVATLAGFGVTRHLQGVSAAGAIVPYLRETSAIGARGENGAAGRSSSERASGNG